MKSFLPAVIVSLSLSLSLIVSIASAALAQTQTNVDVQTLLQKVSLSLSPQSGSFQEESTFDVNVFLDTRGGAINTVELHISFPPDKLTLVRPLGNKSIIGVWLESPAYSNTDGTAEFIGIIPNGIKTSNGLIGTLTFRAIASGEATVKILSNSRVLVNDGLGTEAIVDLGRAVYTIIPKPPEGVAVFSETHPVQDQWYNNNSPSFTWQKDAGVNGFSYLIDTKPFTVPDNAIVSGNSGVSFQELKDGVWYFHIKAQKNGIWGSTTNFAAHIDTEPPAKFYPEAQIIDANHVLISFFTTDVLSGIDHYEVGVIDRSQPAVESPAFVPAESPYQLPKVPGDANVVVRAIDRAGNVRDATIAVHTSLYLYLQNHAWFIWILFFALLALAIVHYFFRHHLAVHVKRFVALWKKEEKKEHEKFKS